MLYKRYKDTYRTGEKVFPLKGTYKTLNMSLRHVARHAGLSFNPTMHMARHTFATTITLAQGVPLETVSKMLGHKRITTTQIYAKITNDKIGRDMAALSEKLDSVFKVVSYRCMASLYFSMLLGDTILPFSAFFFPNWRAVPAHALSGIV